ncbi:uncharacterized protein LOC116293356 [Actinia tenebrosa]|uniref:Uncharacterized protein LOC116293356 n=1 Tax=Actinia tenebrosa TaxID=6105 RepID=A0A6P8HJS6_ACTTE|nr:uncharacterized protein LOC116293356 [Actinia tenebrosa]
MEVNITINLKQEFECLIAVGYNERICPYTSFVFSPAGCDVCHPQKPAFSKHSANVSESSGSDLEELFTSTGAEDFEPVATQEESLKYQREVAEEEEQLIMLNKRFEEEVEVQVYSLLLGPRHRTGGVFCCADIDRCQEKLNHLVEEGPGEPPSCITAQPGFSSGCLDEWVLEVAAVGLRTRKNQRYASFYEQGRATKSQFLRSVPYRQFTRLVWEYLGNSKRLPLPYYAYNAIRARFPSEDGEYKGFKEEEEDEDEQNDSERCS